MLNSQTDAKCCMFVLEGIHRREVGKGTCMCLMEQKTFIRQYREAPERKADLALLEVNFIYLDNFIVDVLVTKKNQKNPQQILSLAMLKCCSQRWSTVSLARSKDFWGDVTSSLSHFLATLLSAKAQNPRH